MAFGAVAGSVAVLVTTVQHHALVEVGVVGVFAAESLLRQVSCDLLII